jgi:pimeloyl-ACP methyl ester carboxylesterase
MASITTSDGTDIYCWNRLTEISYLSALVEALNLTNAVHVGHSTGGGEVARYIGRHGTKRVAKAVLIGDEINADLLAFIKP